MARKRGRLRTEKEIREKLGVFLECRREAAGEPKMHLVYGAAMDVLAWVLGEDGTIPVSDECAEFLAKKPASPTLQ